MIIIILFWFVNRTNSILICFYFEICASPSWEQIDANGAKFHSICFFCLKIINIIVTFIQHLSNFHYVKLKVIHHYHHHYHHNHHQFITFGHVKERLCVGHFHCDCIHGIGYGRWGYGYKYSIHWNCVYHHEMWNGSLRRIWMWESNFFFVFVLSVCDELGLAIIIVPASRHWSQPAYMDFKVIMRYSDIRCGVLPIQIKCGSCQLCYVLEASFQPIYMNRYS